MKLGLERKLILYFGSSILCVLILGCMFFLLNSKTDKLFIPAAAAAVFTVLIILFYFSLRKEVKRIRHTEFNLKLPAAALENINECVAITDSRNKILFTNRALLKVYGYTRDELRNKDISVLYSKQNTGPGAAAESNPAIREGWSGETLHRTKSGAELMVRVSNSAVYNENGEKIALVSVAEDITERKKTEEEIRRYIEELQVSKDLLEENAEELIELNAKLYESEKQLIELNNNKDKFFSIISHDLRSPFNSLVGLSDILVNDIDSLSNEEVKYFSRNIYDASKGVLNLVDRLLEWSRLQTGKIHFAPKTVSLYKLVNEISEVLKGNTIKKNIDLRNEVRENTFIFADEDMLTSILQNLISNALKFTGINGHIKIFDRDADNFIEVYVRDDGIGMTDDAAGKLFHIETSTTTLGTAHEKGTGLGLILCKELVEKNNGKIRVKSLAGKGTTFIFSVPREEILQSR